MKKIKFLMVGLFLSLIVTGCFETNITDEQARKLPVCVETSDNVYTMSQGSIGEVGDYYNQAFGKETYEMYPRKGGKQLIFKVNNETILMDTNYIELEKGACMEISHVIVKDKNGKKGLEADSSNSTDYRTLTKVAEYVFKF